MAWGDIIGNRLVTFADLQSSGINLNGGQSHSSSNQLMTKTDITTKYNVNTGNLSGYTSNQLVNRSAVVSGITSYSYRVSSSSISDQSLSCSYNTVLHVRYSDSPTLSNAIILYIDAELIYPLAGGTNYFYKISENYEGAEQYSAEIGSTGIVNYLLSCNAVNQDMSFISSNAAGEGSLLEFIITVNGVEIINESLTNGNGFYNYFSIPAGSTVTYSIDGTFTEESIYIGVSVYSYEGEGMTIKNNSINGVGAVSHYDSFTSPNEGFDVSISLDPYI